MIESTAHEVTGASENVILDLYGGQVPKGVIRISGAKNSATRLIAAATLTRERIHLYNFPTQLVDVNVKVDFLRNLGVTINLNHNDDSVDIVAEDISDRKLEYYDYPVRTTYLLAAAQLVRNGVAYIPYPSGCKIGERKYDLHIISGNSKFF